MKNLLTWLSGIYYLAIWAFIWSAVIVGWGWDEVTLQEYGMSDQMIGYIAGMLIMLKYAHLEARYDSRRYWLDKKINHISSAFWRLVTMAFLHFIFNFTGIFGFWTSLFISGSILASFSFWFDIRFNTLIKKPWNFVGTTSVYDRVMGKYNWLIELVVTLIALIIVIRY
jgi:hypothetical protein